MSSPNCFTYGSLMCADIMETVSGARFASEVAHLDGYSRHPILDADYPGMVPRTGASVPGIVYRDLDATALVRLDAFEGPDYLRTLVTLRLADGANLSAWAYVYRAELADRLLPGDWDFAHFERESKARFEARYVGYQAIPGSAAGEGDSRP